MSQVRVARPDEVEQLSDLALRSKAYWGYDGAFLEACRDELTLTPDYLDTNPTFVLEDDGRVVGLYSLESMEAGEVELGMLFIDPDVIGRGYGSKLLAHAVQTAARHGHRTIWIQSDPGAEGFYRSHGAVTVGHLESKSLPGRMLPWMRLRSRSHTDRSSSSAF